MADQYKTTLRIGQPLSLLITCYSPRRPWCSHRSMTSSGWAWSSGPEGGSRRVFVLAWSSPGHDLSLACQSWSIPWGMPGPGEVRGGDPGAGCECWPCCTCRSSAWSATRPSCAPHPPSRRTRSCVGEAGDLAVRCSPSTETGQVTFPAKHHRPKVPLLRRICWCWVKGNHLGCELHLVGCDQR